MRVGRQCAKNFFIRALHLALHIATSEIKLLRAISVVPIFARGCNALREMLRRVLTMRACSDAASVGSSTGGLAE